MEHGGDGYPAGFHGVDVFSSLLDEERFYDGEYKEVYNDVNVGEGFYRSSVHRGGATDGGILREDDNKRGSPLAPVQPQRARNLPEKFGIPVTIANLQTERTVSRSGVHPESGIKGSINSSESARSPAPVDLIRLQIGQSWARPSVMQPHSGGNAVRSEGFLWQGIGVGNEDFNRQGAIVRRGTGANPSVTMAPSGGGGATAGSPVDVRTNMNATSAGDDIGVGDGITTLFVGELQWWTTDADLEAELCKYGSVKKVKFVEEKSNGKSKGYAHVELYDLATAISCQQGMNGHIFNGRPCVVAISSPQGVRKLGDAQVSRNEQGLAKGPRRYVLAQTGGGGAHTTGYYGREGGGGGGGDTGGGGNWGRSEMGNIGHMGNSRDLAGPMGGGGIMGNGGMAASPPLVFKPGAILGQEFDRTGSGMAMGRTSAGYGGFPFRPAGGYFPGMVPLFPPVMAPHSSPAFFGRGMPAGGACMWPEPSKGGSGAGEQSSYRDSAASDQRYGEGSHGRDRSADWNWPEASDRRHERDKGTWHGLEWSEMKEYGERNGGWDKADIWRWQG